MPKSKEGFSCAEHTVCGVALQKIHNMLCELTVRIGDKYRLQGREMLGIKRSLADIDKLRCSMDEALYREHYDGESLFGVYYRTDAKESPKSLIKINEQGKCLECGTQLTQGSIL